MKTIPDFPAFIPITASMHDDLYPFLNNLSDGISEFTFLNLYLHQSKYDYKISQLTPKIFILEGKDKDGPFFSLMGAAPEKKLLCSLLETYGRWKTISQRIYDVCAPCVADMGFESGEDRDNADYLYSRESLASLAGKSLHKKRNLANGFENSYKWELRPLNASTASDAGKVLDEWYESRPAGAGSDYTQAGIALSLLLVTNLTGWIVYAEERPVGWALGEYVCAGTMFVVHFEKALDSFRGVYQFVNRATALSLPKTVEFINREQDLGNEGLRQAKMTYRPVGFVKKYWIKKSEDLTNEV